MSASVCVVVVTHNHTDLLRGCLDALLAQTRAPDRILVVDNASTDDTGAMLARAFADIPVLRLDENLGGGGGFHAGMIEGRRLGFDWIWTMDDDAEPDSRCLEHLLEYATDKGRVYAAVPTDRGTGRLCWPAPSLDETGKKSRLIYEIDEAMAPTIAIHSAGLLGTLFHRDTLDVAGYPNPDFFIRGDEVEYSHRMRAAGFPTMMVRDAMIYHPSPAAAKTYWILGKEVAYSSMEPWKAYYNTRNHVYICLYVTGNLPALAWRLFSGFWFLWREDQKPKRLLYYLRAVFDGVFKRLGKVYVPD